jgi:signal recognition particle receptor subunit beta
MVQINFALKEVNCKVVYYGPGLSGKTTNLEVVHSKAPTEHVGDLTSIATEGDRTLFFDFLPLNLGSVSGMTTKFQIYTVPGQVYYNSTRKLVLQGADGLVFVADSRRGKMDENLESFANLEDNVQEYGMDIHTIPLVLQYNKRDLGDVYTIEEMQEKLNKYNSPYFEAVAVTGEGVFPTLKKLSQMVLESLNRQQSSSFVKTPKAQKTPEKVTAGAPSSASAKAGGSSGAAKASTGKSVGRGASTKSRSGASSVVREPVSSSPGVKSIERKAPAGNRVVRKKPTGAKAKSKAGKAEPKPVPKKSKTGLVVALVILALAGGAAAAYFAGLFDSFLGK